MQIYKTTPNHEIPKTWYFPHHDRALLSSKASMVVAGMFAVNMAP